MQKPTVLILGESGAGKKWLHVIFTTILCSRNVALWSHESSCGCDSRTELLESEAVLAEKLICTGALTTQRALWVNKPVALFFLDEIGDIPMAMQK